MTSASDKPFTAPQAAQTAWGIVIEPGGPCNHYRWDDARGALTLERVERPVVAQARGADLARLPLLGRGGGERDDARLSASGPGLLALVLATPANPRGTWLEARVLGAFRVADAHADAAGAPSGSLEDYIALTVPVADPALTDVTSIETLTLALRERAQRALLAIAPDVEARIYQGLSEPGTSGSFAAGWLDGAAIMACYRAGRAAISRKVGERRRAEAEAGAERLTTDAEAAGEALLLRLGREAFAGENRGGAWRGLAGVSATELRARGGGLRRA